MNTASLGLRILTRMVAQGNGWALGVSQSPPPPRPVAAAEDAIIKPGCTAADEAITVHGHLQGLAQGWGGFGVLRESQKRLVMASKAAEIAGASDLSQQFQAIATNLPSIRTPEEAGAEAEKLGPLLQQAWELGRRCGLSGELLNKAKELAGQVKSGHMTREQAVGILKKESAK